MSVHVTQNQNIIIGAPLDEQLMQVFHVQLAQLDNRRRRRL